MLLADMTLPPFDHSIVEIPFHRSTFNFQLSTLNFQLLVVPPDTFVLVEIPFLFHFVEVYRALFFVRLF